MVFARAKEVTEKKTLLFPRADSITLEVRRGLVVARHALREGLLEVAEEDAAAHDHSSGDLNDDNLRLSMWDDSPLNLSLVAVKWGVRKREALALRQVRFAGLQDVEDIMGSIESQYETEEGDNDLSEPRHRTATPTTTTRRLFQGCSASGGRDPSSAQSRRRDGTL